MNNLIGAFPNIICDKPNDLHTICIDVNTILHQVCMKSHNLNNFKTLLIKELKKMISITKPKSLALFTDGQAVLAKARTQIKRRNKHLYSKSSGLSSLNLTPGTPFMDFVDSTLESYLKTLKIPTYYSSSKEYNEGEIKLFDWLIEKDISETICIIGNDSDLIVLALAKCPLLNVYIFNNWKYISLFKLVQKLSLFTPSKFNCKWHPVRKDFVLLSMFQGNDYNTRLCGFNKLLSAYKHLQASKGGFLIRRDGTLNLRAIKKLLSKVNVTENRLYDKIDVENYFESLLWNLSLYNGRTISDFIPSYNNINIKTVMKYFPHKVKFTQTNSEWLDWRVYLLLLMPSVGQNLLPTELQHYMNDNSPIKDLFPDPCPVCIEWKEKLRNLVEPVNGSEEELAEYKKILCNTHVGYTNHLDEAHPVRELPIKRIHDIVVI